MKYILNIAGVQTKSVNLARHAKKPTYLIYVCRSVLDKLRLEKGIDKNNDGYYKKGTEKFNGVHYGMFNRKNNSMEHAAIIYVITEQYRTCNRNGKNYGTNVMKYITALKS